MTRPDTPIPDDAGLRRLASEAECFSPWRGRLYGSEWQIIQIDDDDVLVPNVKDDVVWAFIAAASPDVVLALLDRLAALTQQEARVRALDDAICDALMAARHGTYDGATVESHLERLLDRFRAALDVTHDQEES